METNIAKIQALFVLWTLVIPCYTICSDKYGSEPCTFLPAPPGKTPPCAQPGLTYCEHPEYYPGQRIQSLILKWHFDHSTFLRDESREEFSSYFYPPPTYKYGPYGPSNTVQPHHDSYFPEPIYIPKPDYPFVPHQPGNTYIPPRINNFTQDFGAYQEQRPQQNGQIQQYRYSNNIPAAQNEGYSPVPNFYTAFGLPPLGAYSQSKVWNRKDDERLGKLTLIRMQRSIAMKENLKKLRTVHSSSNHTYYKERRKRQADSDSQTLCRTRSQYIMPRAALNNKGNWMYVVNMPEFDQRFTQLVKTETCISQTCSNLCSIPVSYTAKCEQKYVQKRLVALEGGGNELYNDVFWIPSCCVCSLSRS